MSETLINSGDNGHPKEPEGPQVLEMRIVAEIGKPMMVHFPILNDKLAAYGFLKMAEKTLDEHYRQQGLAKIIHLSKGGMMNFVRGRFK